CRASRIGGVILARGPGARERWGGGRGRGCGGTSAGGMSLLWPRTYIFSAVVRWGTREGRAPFRARGSKRKARHKAGCLIAPDRMQAGIAGVPHQGQAFAQPSLVLGVHGDSPAPAPQHSLNALVLSDEKGAGGAAHEHLHAGTTRQLLEMTQLFCVLL